MNKYDEVDDLLVVGVGMVSNHVLWALKNIAYELCPRSELNIIKFTDNLCDGDGNEVMGSSTPGLGGIVINLHDVFESARGSVIDDKGMHTSIRVALTKELIDTALHEVGHLLLLTEDETVEQAHRLSWACAEKWDIEFENFGPYLDEQLVALQTELAEDVLEYDCQEWKKIQYHMVQNKLAYFNPTVGSEVRELRDAFNHEAQPDSRWNHKGFIAFNPPSSQVQPESETQPAPRVAAVAAAVPAPASTAVAQAPAPAIPVSAPPPALATNTA